MRDYLQNLKGLQSGPKLFEAVCDVGTKVSDKTKVCKTIVGFLDSIPTSSNGGGEGAF